MAAIAGVLSAEDAPDAPRRFSVSWGAGMEGQPDATGRTSVLGFGMTANRDDGLTIRNQIEFCNGVLVREDIGEKHYKKTLADKLSVGFLTRGGLFRSYGFVEGRVGTCGSELWDSLENPAIWNLGAGTGLDLYATGRLSYFLEIGFLGNFYEGDFIPQQRFELGVMGHF